MQKSAALVRAHTNFCAHNYYYDSNWQTICIAKTYEIITMRWACTESAKIIIIVFVIGQFVTWPSSLTTLAAMCIFGEAHTKCKYTPHISAIHSSCSLLEPMNACTAPTIEYIFLNVGFDTYDYCYGEYVQSTRTEEHFSVVEWNQNKKMPNWNSMLLKGGACHGESITAAWNDPMIHNWCIR